MNAGTAYFAQYKISDAAVLQKAMTVVINVLMTLHVSGSVGLRLLVYSINAPSPFLDCVQKWVIVTILWWIITH